MNARISEAAKMIREANCAIALTGAGMSVASGIPDFRSPGGLWSKYDPDQVVSTSALHKKPENVWKFLDEVMCLIGRAEPNPAHKALAEIEQAGFLKAVITQNIDGLHQLAGSTTVIEYHGNCRYFYCMGCSESYPLKKVIERGKGHEPPRCKSCGGLIRPDIVFFGERIPGEALDEGEFYANGSDLVIVAGTSGEVAPANLIPAQIKRNGGRMIEISKNGSAYSSVSDLSLYGPVEEILPAIADELIKK